MSGDGASQGSFVQRRLFQAATIAVGAGAAVVVRGGVTLAWKKVRGADPPAHPSDPGVGVVSALTWAVSLAVGAAVARVLAERVAAAGWQRATGSPPPVAAS